MPALQWRISAAPVLIFMKKSRVTLQRHPGKYEN